MVADCTPCPGGHHCPELGTATPRACGAGNFSVRSNPSILPSLQHQPGFWHGGRLGVPQGMNLGWMCESFKQHWPPVLAPQRVKLLFQRLGMFLQQVWGCSRHRNHLPGVQCCSCCCPTQSPSQLTCPVSAGCTPRVLVAHLGFWWHFWPCREQTALFPSCSQAGLGWHWDGTLRCLGREGSRVESQKGTVMAQQFPPTVLGLIHIYLSQTPVEGRWDIYPGQFSSLQKFGSYHWNSPLRLERR